jgi:hypothetical protein
MKAPLPPPTRPMFSGLLDMVVFCFGWMVMKLDGRQLRIPGPGPFR